ncbi:MAG TPA: DUF4184 family protein [Marmoricola sp.]|nr:DUF4184 family protein [Marmoricola sp.]
MPLAPAHPAVVLPLRRLGLPLTALVVGAMAPDAPVYLPVGVGYRTAHSWPGLLVASVVGLVLLVLWSFVVRDAVVDLVPALRRRLPLRDRPDARAWWLAPVAVLVGVGTHLLWDAATHDWGFLVEDLAFLRTEHASLPLYRWLQHASTVVGTLVVAAYGVVGLRRRPVRPRTAEVRRPGLWWAPVLLGGLAAGGLGVEAAVGVVLVALLVVSITWQIHARRR